LLVAAGRGLEERRQWALSSVSGPPCFGLCSCFARFFKNHIENNKEGWFVGVIWLVYWSGGGLFISTFDLQKGQALTD
jgi:hypothetical protein